MKSMKILVLSLPLAFMLTSAFAQAPMKVKDKYKGYQLKREVFIKWGDFKPKWFYMLFLNKYRKGPDRRNILQLLPTAFAVDENRKQAEKEAEEVDVVFKQEMFKAVDRKANKFYHLLYENKFKNLNRELDLLSAKAVGAEVDFDMLLSLRQQKERINSNIKITKEAYQDDALKEKQFRLYLADLMELRGYYIRIINVFSISKKHLKE